MITRITNAVCLVTVVFLLLALLPAQALAQKAALPKSLGDLDARFEAADGLPATVPAAVVLQKAL